VGGREGNHDEARVTECSETNVRRTLFYPLAGGLVFSDEFSRMDLRVVEISRD